jgi:hypothetical protein
VEYVEIKGMTGGESVDSFLIDPEVLKRGEQMGVVFPVVHALTDGDWMINDIIAERIIYYFNKHIFLNFSSQLTRKISYLASNAAKPKVKEIDGEFFQLWII